MIVDYTFDGANLKKAARMDMATVTGSDLDFYLFCGSVIFRVDTASFDPPWDWTPIFDFALKLYEIALNLDDGQERLLEFTECEDTISFVRSGDSVAITATYTSDRASVSLSELRVAAAQFLEKLKTDLLSRFPALAQNAAFKERLALVGLDI